MSYDQDKMNSQLTPEHILQTGMAFWPSRTLLTAVAMGLFTELAQTAMSLESISERLGLHQRGARDFLDALVALGFLKRADGYYSNTPETDLFLDRNKQSYIGGILEMASRRLYPLWSNLSEALRTGKPQNEIRNGDADLFETLYSDPDALKEFLAAMTGVSHAANRAIARQFPWRDYHTFVDVGTAQGDLAVQVALSNPHLRGMGFDRPEVGPVFQQYARASGVRDRLDFMPGNFFTNDLPNADVVLMGIFCTTGTCQRRKCSFKKHSTPSLRGAHSSCMNPS